MIVDAFHYEGSHISYSESQFTFDFLYMGHRKKRTRSRELRKRYLFIEAGTPLPRTTTYKFLPTTQHGLPDLYLQDSHNLDNASRDTLAANEICRAS